MKDKKIEKSLYRIVTVLRMLLITLVIANIVIVGISVEINDRVDELESNNQFLKEQVTRQINATKNLKKEIEELKKRRWIYKGDFDVTAYCKCEKCCGKWSNSPTFTGTVPRQGRTVAVDPDVIPLGSELVIDNHIYVAEDTGSAIKGKKIDIYFDKHEDAKKFGRQEKEVYL